MQRWFDGSDRTPSTRMCIPLVWGFHFLSYTKKRGVGNTFQWNDFDTPYWDDYRYEIMKNEMGSRRRNFVRFSVIITSLPYMKVLYKDFREILVLPNPNPHRRYGFHLYMQSNGTCLAGLIYLSKSKNLRCLGSSVAPIINIYPVIRYEWEARHPKAALTYGLDFRSCFNRVEEGSASGDRYYHRFGDQCLKAGNVYELTDEGLEDLGSHFPESRFIGFYVCAGAKLLVFDQYHKDITRSDHNRTLVQQGGFVICQGPFQIDLPVEAEKSENSDDFSDGLELEKKIWDEFCSDTCLKKVDGTPMTEIRSQLRNMRQPVLFLGPINSKYGAVTWAVEVRKESRRNLRKTLLIPPNRSRIIAIADGKEAFREIKARIQYEMLHDSVVTHHRTDFAIPKSPENNQENDISMVRRIVNVGNERSFNVEYDTDPREYIQDNIIHDVNISSAVVTDFDEIITRFLDSQKSRLAVPPMYPPAVVLDQQDVPDVFSIPSREMDIENFDNRYVDIPGLKLRLRNPFDGIHAVFTFQKYGPVRAYHFKRLQKKGEQDWENRWGYYQGPDPIYRLGVDGWMWQKFGNCIYKEHINCFLHSTNPPVPPAPVSHQRPAPSREDESSRKRHHPESTQSSAPSHSNQPPGSGTYRLRPSSTHGQGSSHGSKSRTESTHRESSHERHTYRSQSGTGSRHTPTRKRRSRSRNRSRSRSRNRSRSGSRNRSRDRSPDRKGPKSGDKSGDKRRKH